MRDELQWYHCVLSTYGSWLYGDARGFRTRHHREHVEGDYQNPPAVGLYQHLEKKSRESLKQEPVVLFYFWREILGTAIRRSLFQQEVLVIAIAFAATHGHFLVKLPRRETRMILGNAKRHAWFVAREYGWQKKLWGKRGLAKPIRDRQHQLNVYHYIQNHKHEGAWTWTIQDTRL